MVIAFVVAFAMLPVRALAEDVWPPAGFDEEEAPLGTDAEEVPEGATVIKSIKMTTINSSLVPGQQYWFGSAIDKSDPNYSHMKIRYAYWLLRTGGSTSNPGGYFPLAGGGSGELWGGGYIPTLDEYQEYYNGSQNKFYYGLVLEADSGYSFPDTITMTYLGKTYKGRCISHGGTSDKENAFYVFDNLTSKIAAPVPLYRMYNTKTSEHLWTKSAKEYESAGSGSYADWKAEGVAWYVPVSSAKPVYRLYNTKSGDHHYTTSLAERDKLVSSGQWRDEGIAFYSASKKDTNTITIYRVYNSRLKRGQHHYTKSAAERDSLVKNSGWKDEGVGFYGYSSANPKPVD